MMAPGFFADISGKILFYKFLSQLKITELRELGWAFASFKASVLYRSLHFLMA